MGGKEVWNLGEKPVTKSNDVSERRLVRGLKIRIGQVKTERVKRNGAKGVALVGKVPKVNVCKITWIWNRVRYSSCSGMLCCKQKSLKPTRKASYFCWLLVLTEDGNLGVTPTWLGLALKICSVYELSVCLDGAT